MTKEHIDLYLVNGNKTLVAMPEVQHLTARRTVSYTYRSHWLHTVQMPSFQAELSRNLAAAIRGAAREQGKLNMTTRCSHRSPSSP